MRFFRFTRPFFLSSEKFVFRIPITVLKRYAIIKRLKSCRTHFFREIFQILFLIFWHHQGPLAATLVTNVTFWHIKEFKKKCLTLNVPMNAYFWASTCPRKCLDSWTWFGLYHFTLLVFIFCPFENGHMICTSSTSLILNW